MPRPRKPVPSYRLHKQSGQAVVTVNRNGKRRDVLLGKYDTPESRAEYQRVLAGLEAPGAGTKGPRGAGVDPTVNELILEFLDWARGYYRAPDGNPAGELDQLARALKPQGTVRPHPGL